MKPIDRLLDDVDQTFRNLLELSPSERPPLLEKLAGFDARFQILVIDGLVRTNWVEFQAHCQTLARMDSFAVEGFARECLATMRAGLARQGLCRTEAHHGMQELAGARGGR